MRPLALLRPVHDLRSVGDRPSPEAPAPVLTLKATSEGWSLLGRGDHVVFEAAGSSARQQCLQFACEHGVVALSS
jgi:hypothetical protein